MEIRVLIKEPGKDPKLENIENSLESLQAAVGGYIETVTLATDLAIICNEEGRLLGLPHCCKICSVDFVGTIVMVGVKGTEFSDLPGDVERHAKQLFSSLWEEKT